MFKIIKSDKDTYITNKVVKGNRREESNVGAAGTLDLFKLYGSSLSGSTPLTEISRILIHFDLSDLKKLSQEGKLDVGDSSFWCKLHLKDVYGGQPTPANFTVNVFPLSASFDEGIGRDVSYYTDSDISNWISSSRGNKWFVTGCGLSSNEITPGDYITSSFSVPSTKSFQIFTKGSEDLIVDVTSIVSATISGEIPDQGFRISFDDSLENNNETYFVKRFASRQAYDESKHPKMTIGFDDSIDDDSQNLEFDISNKVTLYNYGNSGDLSNLISGSSTVSGSNCLLLRLLTEISGGYYSLEFSGSQHSFGTNPTTGIYQAEINVSSFDSTIKTKLIQSGSVEFLPIWSSLDKTVAYVTGSAFEMKPSLKTSSRNSKNYVVSVLNVKPTYHENQEAYAKVNIFDYSSPMIKAKKVPHELPGIVLKKVYYRIRDAVTNEEIVPFETDKNSTKVSSDSSGMFFTFNTSGFLVGRSYVIDIMIDQSGTKTEFINASPVFRVEK